MKETGLVEKETHTPETLGGMKGVEAGCDAQAEEKSSQIQNPSL